MIFMLTNVFLIVSFLNWIIRHLFLIAIWLKILDICWRFQSFVEIKTENREKKTPFRPFLILICDEFWGFWWIVWGDIWYKWLIPHWTSIGSILDSLGMQNVHFSTTKLSSYWVKTLAPGNFCKKQFRCWLFCFNFDYLRSKVSLRYMEIRVLYRNSAANQMSNVRESNEHKIQNF